MVSGLVQVEGITAVAGSGGSGGVATINGLAGAINLTSVGATIAITPSGNNINLESAGSAPSFNLITSGTNTTANMVVDSGASITATGTGSIVATTVTTNANLTGVITSSGNATSIASQTGTGTKFVVDTSPTLVTPNIGTATGTGLILTSASATAFEVGANGSTNPALQIDASTASSANGLKITSTASGAGVTLGVISSNGNDPLIIASKGSAALVMSSSQTGQINLKLGTNTRMTVNDSSVVCSFGGVSSGLGLHYNFPFVGSDTGLTAGTNTPLCYFNLSGSRTHASNTTVVLQTDFRITGALHAFATAGGTITDCAAFSVDGPVSAGTNATITNSHGLYIPTAALTGTVTNAYGITVAAPSGAGTLNAAVNAVGDILAAGNVKLGTAGNGIYIKEGTNGCMGTGTLSGGTLVVSTTKVTANSRIFLSDQGGSVTNIGSLYISARSAGTSFTVNSSNVLDASTFAWIIFEPA